MASDETGEGKRVAVNVGIGTEIDRSIGELISALLKPAATELGSLIGDTIGLLSDPIRKRRKFNAEKGLSEVRAKLDASGVEMKDITPLKEEELHFLIEGMSLSADENLRGLWTGLFAEALKPNSGITAERPFFAVLNSLTSLDAKIIEFLAFSSKTDAKLRESHIGFIPQNPTELTEHDKLELERVRKENKERQQNAIRDIKEKAVLYGIDTLSGSDWSDNLRRQGVIERTPIRNIGLNPLQLRSFEKRDLIDVVEHLNKQFHIVNETTKRNSTPPDKLISYDGFNPQVALEVQLTDFGRRLARACGLF